MKNKYILISLMLIALIFFASGYFISEADEEDNKEKSELSTSKATVNPLKADDSLNQEDNITLEKDNVSQIVDGDTIKLVSGETIRLIGINTPESSEKYSSEATDYIEYLINELGDGEVSLGSDVTDKDKYNRLLRYVYVNSPEGDEIFVNLEMIKKGWAHAYPYEPDVKYITEFATAEEEAKNAGIGLWVPSKEVNLLIYEVNYDAEGNDNENLNDEYVIFLNDGTEIVDMTGWTVKDEATHIYTFPIFSLDSSNKVTLYTGEGTDTLAELYWGRKGVSFAAVWNNGGDTVYLRDAEGGLVDSYSW